MKLKKLCIYSNIKVIEKIEGFLFINILTNNFFFLNKIKDISMTLKYEGEFVFYVRLLKKKKKKFFFLSLKLLDKCMQDLLIGYYKVCLIMKGMGYRYKKERKNLYFKLGLSHEIIIKIPSNIYINVINIRSFEIYSPILKDFRQFISLIRSYKIPDIYKGKGFLYENEIIKLKKGKTTY